MIDGNPDKVTDVTDVWTFARDVPRAIPTGSWSPPKPGNDVGQSSAAAGLGKIGGAALLLAVASGVSVTPAWPATR